MFIFVSSEHWPQEYTVFFPPLTSHHARSPSAAAYRAVWCKFTLLTLMRRLRSSGKLSGQFLRPTQGSSAMKVRVSCGRRGQELLGQDKTPSYPDNPGHSIGKRICARCERSGEDNGGRLCRRRQRPR